MKRQMPFWIGLLYELALLFVAGFWGQLFHDEPFSTLHFQFQAVGIGIVAAIPPFFVFFWAMRSKSQVLYHFREMLDAGLRAAFGRWSVLQLALISIVAGVSEEALFRGAIQGSLAWRVGGGTALVLASLLFGASHLFTWTYGLFAASIGLYLGGLWIWNGNLLTCMVAHAVYDFGALVYFLKIRQRSKE